MSKDLPARCEECKAIIYVDDSKPLECSKREGKMSTELKHIYKKILEVHKNIAPIPKGGVNAFHKYKYQAWEDVLPALNTACAKAGLLIFQEYAGHAYEARSSKPQESDSKSPLLVARYTFRLLDADSGEEVSFLQVGAAIDSDDKGFAKAATAAYKNFALKLFQIPTHEDKVLDTDFYAPAGDPLITSSKAKSAELPTKAKSAELPVLEVITVSKSQLSKFQTICAKHKIDYLKSVKKLESLPKADVPKWKDVEDWVAKIAQELTSAQTEVQNAN